MFLRLRSNIKLHWWRFFRWFSARIVLIPHEVNTDPFNQHLHQVNSSSDEMRIHWIFAFINDLLLHSIIFGDWLEHSNNIHLVPVDSPREFLSLFRYHSFQQNSTHTKKNRKLKCCERTKEKIHNKLLSESSIPRRRKKTQQHQTH